MPTEHQAAQNDDDDLERPELALELDKEQKLELDPKSELATEPELEFEQK